MQVAEAIHRYGKGLGAQVLPVYGGQPIGRQLTALRRGVDVVVATPGRALDHLGRGTLRLDGLAVVVLDEADEMLDMGFAEDIDALLTATPAERQTVLFSATMPSRIATIARRHLRDPVRIRIAETRAAAGEGPRVRQTAYVLSRAHKPAALGRILDVEAPAAAIVFCRTRIEVDQLTETLNGRGYRAEALHGGMSQEQRDRVMTRLRSGASELLVATDVAARGLDVEQLTHVVNYDVPSAPDAYVHRIGRVGRAGREGVAITLAEPREHRMLKNIERVTGRRIEIQKVPTVADLRTRRLEMMRASLREAILGDELDGFRVVVETLADEFDVMDVALAAVKLADDAVGGPADEVEIPEVAPPRRSARRARRAAAPPRPRPRGRGPAGDDHAPVRGRGAQRRRAPAGPGGRRRGRVAPHRPRHRRHRDLRPLLAGRGPGRGRRRGHRRPQGEHHQGGEVADQARGGGAPGHWAEAPARPLRHGPGTNGAGAPEPARLRPGASVISPRSPPATCPPPDDADRGAVGGTWPGPVEETPEIVPPSSRAPSGPRWPLALLVGLLALAVCAIGVLASRGLGGGAAVDAEGTTDRLAYSIVRPGQTQAQVVDLLGSRTARGGVGPARRGPHPVLRVRAALGAPRPLPVLFRPGRDGEQGPRRLAGARLARQPAGPDQGQLAPLPMAIRVGEADLGEPPRLNPGRDRPVRGVFIGGRVADRRQETRVQRRRGRRDVLQVEQPPAGPQEIEQLPIERALARVGEMVDGEGRDDQVESAEGGERPRQVVLPQLDRVVTGEAAPGRREHGRGEVDPDRDRLRPHGLHQRDQAAVPRADVQEAVNARGQLLDEGPLAALAPPRQARDVAQVQGGTLGLVPFATVRQRDGCAVVGPSRDAHPAGRPTRVLDPGEPRGEPLALSDHLGIAEARMVGVGEVLDLVRVVLQVVHLELVRRLPSEWK